jgi:hypothetical protein
MSTIKQAMKVAMVIVGLLILGSVAFAQGFVADVVSQYG